MQGRSINHKIVTIFEMFNFKTFLLPLNSLLFELPNNNACIIIIMIHAAYSFHKCWLLFLQAKVLTCAAVENELPCIIWHSHIRNHFFYHLVDGSFEKINKTCPGWLSRLLNKKTRTTTWNLITGAQCDMRLHKYNEFCSVHEHV